jgi:hypothetical protein
MNFRVPISTLNPNRGKLNNAKFHITIFPILCTLPMTTRHTCKTPGQAPHLQLLYAEPALYG